MMWRDKTDITAPLLRRAVIFLPEIVFYPYCNLFVIANRAYVCYNIYKPTSRKER